MERESERSLFYAVFIAYDERRSPLHFALNRLSQNNKKKEVMSETRIVWFACVYCDNVNEVLEWWSKKKMNRLRRLLDLKRAI